MSYCRFLTVSLVLLLAHRALESDVVVTLREQKARSLIAPPIVGRAICRCSQHATRMVTAECDSGFIGQLVTRSGYVGDSLRGSDPRLFGAGAGEEAAEGDR